jgi:predicted transcriptional regulator
MPTTIQISTDLQKELISRKMHVQETYEDVIWDLVEDTQSINEETKRDIAEAMADIKAGRVYTSEDVYRASYDL